MYDWILCATLLLPTLAEDRPAAFRLLGQNAAGALLYERPKDRARMVWIPAGEFIQNRYARKKSDPVPRRTIRVDGFAIDETEVTNARFAAFLNARGDDRDDQGRALLLPVRNGLEKVDAAWRPRPGEGDLPALGVTGHGASTYAAWVGGALPRLDEWQKAAGGLDGRLFPWGDEPPTPSHANYRSTTFDATDGPLPVGAHPDGRSPFGLLDVAGNVYERVWAPGRDAPVVIRGGSWASPHPLNLRTLDMCVMPMEVADRTVGFRCVVRSGAGLPGSPVETGHLLASPIGRTRVDGDPAGFPPGKDPAATAKALRLATSWSAARREARERNCPILVSLHYDTCGQCDRTKVGLFQEPRFVEFFNEQGVVIVGQFAWDAEDQPHPPAEDGSCPLLPGLTCEQHFDIWLELFQLVGGFDFSPGMFILDPRVGEDGYPEDRILVPERELPKWGGGAETYIARFREAQEQMGAALPRSRWRSGR